MMCNSRKSMSDCRYQAASSSHKTYVGFSSVNLLSARAGPVKDCTGSAFSHDSWELCIISLGLTITILDLREELARASSSINAEESRLLIFPDRFASGVGVDTDNVAVALVQSHIAAPWSWVYRSLRLRGEKVRFDVLNVKRGRHGDAESCS